MRKSFTRLFGFLLLNVMMLFTLGLYAQEPQSTVELYAGSVDQCYNATNSYISKITTKDFIKMKSFSLVLKFDPTKFGFVSVVNANPLLGGTITPTVDAVAGTVTLKWSSATQVTIGDNVATGLFDVKFGVLNFPNNTGTDLFNSTLTWDAASKLYYGDNYTGSYQVSTTALQGGTLNVPVSYTAANFAYTVTPVSCAGGQANITITNPVGTGMNYYFNGNTTPSTTGQATAAAPSSNFVRVRDANGCYSHLLPITVAAPNPLVFNGATTETPTCSGGNGEIQFSISGGTAPYTYWVVPGAASDPAFVQLQTDLTASGGVTTAPVFASYKYINFQVLKPSGVYQVAVSDANGCVDLRNAANWKSVTVAPSPAPVAFTATPTNILCNAGTDGKIVVSAVSGGTTSPTGNYSVTINGINWLAVTTTTSTATFSNLAAGTYTVTVKDYNGCATVTSTTITQPAAMQFTTTYTDVACAGTATPTGSISVSTITGGTASYQFAVLLGASATAPATGWVAAPGTIGSLAAGYYSVFVKDANGCIKSFANQDGSGNVLPIQQPGVLAFTTSADNVAAIEASCNPGTYTLTVTATSGRAPYNYSFDGGTTTGTTASKYFSGLTADQLVNVVVTDANGCTISKTVNIDVPDALTLTATVNLPPTCHGGNDGRVTVTAGGGQPPYQYSTDNVLWFTNPVLAVPEGATTIYLKDSKDCTTASTTVTVATLTASTVTATTTNITCQGGKTGINIVNTWQAGRTIQYIYAATEAAVYATGTVFTPATINTVATTTPTTFVAGTYYVGARDQYGCTAPVIKVVITENTKIQMTASSTPAGCSGLFTGTLTINTLGGNGHPSYAVVNNLFAISNLTNTDFLPIDTWTSTTTIGKQVVQAQRGTYYVVLRDGCVTDNSVFAGPFIVDGYKPIAIDNTKTAKTNVTCNGAKNGSITIPLTSVSGGKPEYDGSGLYTFKLYLNGSIIASATNNTGVFTGLDGGTYSVTITDATNCPLVSTPAITIVNPAKVVISDVKITHFTCKDSRDGRLAITVAGGTPDYWLAVNASANLTGNDIKPGDWIAFASGSTTKTYIATEPGVYYLYVKDANGCTGNTVSVTVSQPAALVATATKTSVSCTVAGTAQVSVIGGWASTTTPTYLYTLGTTTNTTGTFGGLSAGNYTVKVKNTNADLVVGNNTYPTVACETSVSFAITGLTPYSYKAVATPVACNGGNNGSLAVTVLGGSAATTTTVGDEYYVQLTTTSNPSLTVAGWKLTSGKVAKFDNLSHAIYSVWISNGTPTDTTNPGYCLLPTGTETPTADGVWTKVASWEVNEPATMLTASATWVKDVTCFGGTDGKFTVAAGGGSAPYKYAAKISILPNHVFSPDPSSSEWQDSNEFVKSVGTWIIWVKDANGCIVGGEGNGTPVDQWRVQVRQPNEVAFDVTKNNDVTCFGTSTAKITVTPTTSAGAPFTYVLSGLDFAGNTVNLTAGTTATATSFAISSIPATEYFGSTTTKTYTLTVTDKNGCSKTSVLPWPIYQNKVLTATIVKADGSFLCPGDASGVIEARATGGSGSYAYRLWKDGVVYTSWVNIPSFIVQIGHTWKVEVSDVALPGDPTNGCMASAQIQLDAPLPVVATLLETTCYSDATASVIIKATGTPGRTFSVRYRLNTASYPSTWTPFTSSNSISITGLIFSNVTVTQNFYYFQIKDDQGCITELVDKSFVPTQHPLEVTLVQTDLNASATITGGISPYTWQVGTSTPTTLPVSGNTFQVVNLPAGTNTVTVADAHGCAVVKTITVVPLSVTAVPANGNNQPNSFTVALTFNRDVTGVVSSTTVTSGTSTPTYTITGSGKAYTVSIKAVDLAAVKLNLGSGIKDVANNALTATSFTYTIGDHVAPTVVVTPPASPVATVFTVGLKFSEPVNGVLDGVTITGGTIDVKGSGSTYTLTVTAKEQTKVDIVLTDAIEDMSANTNKLAPVSLTYTTGDFTAPQLVTWTPLDETTANNHPTFKMTFSENVALGAGGNLKVYKVATSTPVLTIPITSTMISGKDVTVTYAVTQSGLDKDARYYVLVDGTALKDIAGNKFDGVSDVAAWTFKTGSFATAITPEGSLEFKVYPNPFVDYVDVVSSSILSKIVVTNIAGQTVKEVVNPEQRIQLNELRSGVYFISLYNTDNVIEKTAKIVKR